MAIVLADLPLSGPDGSTTIVDASGRNPWLIATGSNTQIQSNALLLDGVGDYIWAPGGDFVFGEFPFRIDMEVRSTQSGRRALVDFVNTSYSDPRPEYQSWKFELDDNGYMQWRNQYPTNHVSGTGTINVRDGNWHKLSVVRDNGVMSFYVDDVLDVSFPQTYAYRRPTQYIGIGAQVSSRNATFDFAGSIRNVLITRPDLEGAKYFEQARRHAVPTDIAKYFEQHSKQYIWTPPWDGGRVRMFTQFKRTRGVPPWWGPTTATTQLPTYKIRGRVMQRDPDGVLPDWPLANVRVALFYRRLNALLDVQLSDVNGYVQFDNLMPGNGAYYGIAFDNEGSPLQNSIIWDRLSSEPGP